MKIHIRLTQITFISILIAFLVAGCGVELLTTTAIQGELQAQQLKSMQRQVQGITNQTAKINLQRAIQTFQAENGRYPTSLNELVPKYLPSIPDAGDGSHFTFDPYTGQINSAPATIPAEDLRRMEQIKYAVIQFAQLTGYYPASLDVLYPNYLSFLPTTTNGEQFIYNSQTGAVSHPKMGMTSPPATSPTPVVGSGISAEYTGAIGIQQQLGNMPNQSGSVGTQMRGSINNIQN
ncbi:MAG: hypothetical protein N3G21_12615, partial [Candidatus Hydrogenedentes bacterium]|nr:hypothetical protein [Candidatus Hydrogenedentota bacterium]